MTNPHREHPRYHNDTARQEVRKTPLLRFIPVNRQSIVEQCAQECNSEGLKAEEFRRLATMLDSLLHFEFHQLLERFKRAYAPVNPDSDTQYLSFDEPSESLNELLTEVLDKANYEQVSESDLEQALASSSLFKIQLKVDFSDFEEILLFCRGEKEEQETLSSWFGLRKKVICFTNYERVVLYFKLKDSAAQSGDSVRSGATMLKLFQNVPKADLEMLFPNTQVTMRLIDKLLIGVPALAGGVVVVSTKLGGSLVLLASLFGYWIGTRNTAVTMDKTAIIALLAGIGALGVHFWKQFNSFKNRKLKFTQTLTQNLYFKNLDNNAGVFHRLLDEAEEEEGKEALLAYFCLLKQNHPISADALDSIVESWLSDKFTCKVDFEIEDALNKLIKYGLVKRDEQQHYQAITISEALHTLDQQWDNLFRYAK